MIKKKVLNIWMTISVLAAGGCVAGSVLMVNAEGIQAIKAINLGNRYLESQDYKQAEAAFKKALKIDPNNMKALEGMLQASFDADDNEVFIKTLDVYLDNLSSGKGSDIDAAQLIKSAESAFDDREEYCEFLDDKSKLLEDDEEWIIAQKMAYINELMDEGKYDEAIKVFKSLIKEYDVEDEQLLIDLYCKGSEYYWKQRDYELAMEYIREVLELVDDSSDLHDEVYVIVRDYAYACKNNQDYEKAREVIDWYVSTFGGNEFSDFLAEIEKMEIADQNVQSIIEELNVAFDNNDITTIENIMLGDEFKECTEQMHYVIFCDSLLKSGNITGHGTAVYKTNGSAYVYYGDFVDGEREGNGLWYYTTGKGNLDKYSMPWSNDMPNGLCTVESYGTMTMHGYGGEVMYTIDTYDTKTVNVDNGIYNGACSYFSEVKDDEPYEYSASYSYYNGVAQKLEVGEYTSAILDWLKYPVPMVYVEEIQRYDYWMEEYYTSYVWQTWTPTVHSVPGLGGKSVNRVYEKKNVDIN